METEKLQVVTGAFGYSGKYIARKLLDAGCRVSTLTSRPGPDPFGGRVKALPLDFRDYRGLVKALSGVSVLYNTYWVRFNYRGFSHSAAVENSRVLFRAAAEAGVERIVHVSITNPSADSPFEYFRGKAAVEQALRETGISHAILRPAVFFGGEDILINNIAWLLRHFPLFVTFGDGNYRLQPIYIEDFARLAVEQGSGRENVTIEAIGPETFTYRELVMAAAAAIGVNRLVISAPSNLAYAVGKVIGMLTGDVVITREEIGGLMAGLLAVEAPPAGTTRLTDWMAEHSSTLGINYASELARRLETA